MFLEPDTSPLHYIRQLPDKLSDFFLHEAKLEPGKESNKTGLVEGI
jgi:hypothetical protein